MKTKLCEIKEKMLATIMAQMDHLETVDVCELGEAIDIVKDIAETEYYCSVVWAMENKAEHEPMKIEHSINKPQQTQSVNAYLHNLADDVHRMMDTMSPEERVMMREKLHELKMLL